MFFVVRISKQSGTNRDNRLLLNGCGHLMRDGSRESVALGKQSESFQESSCLFRCDNVQDEKEDVQLRAGEGVNTFEKRCV